MNVLEERGHEYGTHSKFGTSQKVLWEQCKLYATCLVWLFSVP